MDINVILSQLLGQTPSLIAWGTGTVVATLIVARRAGPSQFLFLAGCASMLLARLDFVVLRGILVARTVNASEWGLLNTVFVGVPSLAAFVCLVAAFWRMFWKKRQAAI